MVTPKEYKRNWYLRNRDSLRRFERTDLYHVYRNLRNLIKSQGKTFDTRTYQALLNQKKTLLKQIQRTKSGENC